MVKQGFIVHAFSKYVGIPTIFQAHGRCSNGPHNLGCYFYHSLSSVQVLNRKDCISNFLEDIFY